jgi:hypothetical protein
LRSARHRAEAERAAAYRLLAELGGPLDLLPVASRLEARLRARERFLDGLLVREEADDPVRVRRLLEAYLAARCLGTLLVRFSCSGKGFGVRVVGEFPDDESMERFAGLCGAERWKDLSDVYRCRNVLAEPADLRTLPIEVKQAAWEASGVPKRLRRSPTLLLGWEVARLAGLPSDAEPFVWTAVHGMRNTTPAGAHSGVQATGVCCYVPHPSGRSKWWDGAGNAERAREFLSSLTAEVRGRRLPMDGPGAPRYLPRMEERGLSFVDERAEPSWAVECLRLWFPVLAARWRAA